jgi:hypothetical protein
MATFKVVDFSEILLVSARARQDMAICEHLNHVREEITPKEVQTQLSKIQHISIEFIFFLKAQISKGKLYIYDTKKLLLDEL